MHHTSLQIAKIHVAAAELKLNSKTPKIEVMGRFALTVKVMSTENFEMNSYVITLPSVL